MGIRVDSLLLYDDIKYLNYWKEYPVEGETYTGLRFEHRENKDVLSWRYYVDIPENQLIISGSKKWNSNAWQFK